MADRILFVDDEPNLLSGLQRMLRSSRGQWEMEFALGGEQAVAMLQAGSYDVIVTDMRMPDIDGADLLRFVAEWCPSTVRMVLSGQADNSSVLRSVRHAHQYISKPCKVDALKSAVGRACETRSLVGRQDLIDYVSRMDRAFCLPEHYDLLLSIIRSGTVTSQALGDVIAMDVGLTAKVLHLANSSFFGTGPTTCDPWLAVSRLGSDTITELVSNAQIFQPVDLGEGLTPLSTITEFSCLVGSVAHELATQRGLGQDFASQAYTAGLLHQIGRILLALVYPDEYLVVEVASACHKRQEQDFEQAVIGITRAETAAYLLALWGLPTAIITAVKNISLDSSHAVEPCPLTDILRDALAIVQSNGGAR